MKMSLDAQTTIVNADTQSSDCAANIARGRNLPIVSQWQARNSHLTLHLSVAIGRLIHHCSVE
jgi:hypothetical protein